MSLLQKSNKKASSRQQINIKGVKDGILMLPDNEYRVVLQVSSVNFELKSEEEQDVLIETYQSFLNSLGCNLQIVVRIRELDMDKYLSDLQERLAGEKEAIYRTQLGNYSKFVLGLIKNNKILTRHFYVIVPYDAKDKDFEAMKEQLSVNCDIVAKGLTRMGMQSRQLTSLEILDLFYSFYNQAQAKVQPITTQALNLLHTNYVRKGDSDDQDSNKGNRVEKAEKRATQRIGTDVRGAGSPGRAIVRRNGGAAELPADRRPVRTDAFYSRLPVRRLQRVARQLNKFQSRRGR
ncbi:MAG TPA: hypothetical protein VGG13_00125 [Candidatus Saccharimonadales bacterium]|jgi:hypothetical protein